MNKLYFQIGFFFITTLMGLFFSIYLNYNLSVSKQTIKDLSAEHSKLQNILYKVNSQSIVNFKEYMHCKDNAKKIINRLKYTSDLLESTARCAYFKLKPESCGVDLDVLNNTLEDNRKF